MLSRDAKAVLSIYGLFDGKAGEVLLLQSFHAKLDIAGVKYENFDSAMQELIDAGLVDRRDDPQRDTSFHVTAAGREALSGP